jgi:hypothetical protein
VLIGCPLLTVKRRDLPPQQVDQPAGHHVPEPPQLVAWFGASVVPPSFRPAGRCRNERQGSNAKHAAQAPRTNDHGTRTINGKNTVDFDGANDWLVSPDGSLTTSYGEDLVTYCAVAALDSLTVDSFVFVNDWNYYGGSQSGALGGRSTGVWGMAMPNVASVYSSDTKPHVFVLRAQRADIGDSDAWVDATGWSGGVPGPTAPGMPRSVMLGSAKGYGGLWGGRFAEWFFYNDYHDDATVAAVVEYLQTKWVPPWTPAAETSLEAWYDASDPATITASAGAVSQVADKSGHGRHLVQATSSAQPTTGVRTVNGRNALDFTATKTMVAAFTGPNNIMIFAVVQRTAPCGTAFAATRPGTTCSSSCPSRWGRRG